MSDVRGVVDVVVVAAVDGEVSHQQLLVVTLVAGVLEFGGVRPAGDAYDAGRIERLGIARDAMAAAELDTQIRERTYVDPTCVRVVRKPGEELPTCRSLRSRVDLNELIDEGGWDATELYVDTLYTGYAKDVDLLSEERYLKDGGPDWLEILLAPRRR